MPGSSKRETTYHLQENSSKLTAEFLPAIMEARRQGVNIFKEPKGKKILRLVYPAKLSFKSGGMIHSQIKRVNLFLADLHYQKY